MINTNLYYMNGRQCCGRVTNVPCNLLLGCNCSRYTMASFYTIISNFKICRKCDGNLIERKLGQYSIMSLLILYLRTLSVPVTI